MFTCFLWLSDTKIKTLPPLQCFKKNRAGQQIFTFAHELIYVCINYVNIYDKKKSIFVKHMMHNTNWAAEVYQTWNLWHFSFICSIFMTCTFPRICYFWMESLGQTVSSSRSPSGNVVGVPVGVDVDAAHAHVLLCALVGVDVVISKNNTPSPGTVDVQNMKIFILPLALILSGI